MAKKKVQYPNRIRNRVLTGIISVALVALLSTLVAFNIKARDYIMILDGKKVSTSDYKLYLYQQKALWENYYGSDVWSYDLGDGYTAEDYATNDALSSLLQQRIAVKIANEKGLTLSAEQKATAQEQFDSLKENYTENMLNTINMSDKRLLQFLEDDMMMSLLYDEMTKDYVFDEADFEEYYATYLVDNEQSLTTVNVDYIITDDESKAQDAKSRMENGEDMLSLIKEFDITYSEPAEDEDDPRATPSAAASVSAFSQELIDLIYTMEEGELLLHEEILTQDEETDTDAETDEETDEEANENTDEKAAHYIVVRVDSIELPDYDEVRETQIEEYTTTKKDEIFEPLFTEWSNAAEVEVNEAMYASISITSLPY